MVQDGAIPELGVGDEWFADLVFDAGEPLRPARTRALLEIVPEIASGVPEDHPGPWFRVTARVHRRPPTSRSREAVALEVPGLYLAYDSEPPLPVAAIVQGRGRLEVDPYDNVAWAFSETRRRCVVDGITLVKAPFVQSGEYPPDWTRLSETPIDRMRKWEDDPGTTWASYIVDIDLR
jgi:hypothetical protein